MLYLPPIDHGCCGWGVWFTGRFEEQSHRQHFVLREGKYYRCPGLGEWTVVQGVDYS